MFSRILVPTDFSATSDAALSCARVLADKFGASLHLLHVLEDPFTVGALVGSGEIPDAPELRAALLKDAETKLAHRLTAHDRQQLRATTQVIVGSPALTIVDYASNGHMNLIVMGTHGRTGMAHLLMGSVAERVVRLASCPVLTTRQAVALEEVPANARTAAAPA